jgi:hypothetical protein
MAVRAERRGDRPRAGVRPRPAGLRCIDPLTEWFKPWRRRLFFRRSVRLWSPRALAESCDTDSQDRMDQQSITGYRRMVDQRSTGQYWAIAWHASARPEGPGIPPSSGPVEPASQTRPSARPGRSLPKSGGIGSSLIFRQALPPRVTILDGPCDPGNPSGAPATGCGFLRSHGPCEGRVNVTKVDVSLLPAARPFRPTLPCGYDGWPHRRDPARQAGARRDRKARFDATASGRGQHDGDRAVSFVALP